MNNEILVIDDDKDALDSYRVIMRKDFPGAKFFQKPPEALDYIKLGARPSLVVTDYNMPGMNGIELLKKIKEISPDSIAAIITGFADVNTAIDAVNEGRVFSFMTKPVKSEVFLSNISRCLGQFEMLCERREIADMKEKFAYMVTHEFKNHLASIMISSEMIEKYKLRMSPEQIDTEMKSIRSTIKYISKLQQEILNLGAIDNEEVERTNIDLVTLAWTVIYNLERIYKNKPNVSFNSNERTIWLESNEIYLKLILNNLINNAIKYSEEGSEIIVEICRRKNEVEVSVKDKGIGIPKGQLDNLFTPFFRAGNSGDKKGSGLGLAIVKKCVDKLNGKIFVNSREGRGSIFSVIFSK